MSTAPDDHIPVLVQPVLDLLAPRPGEVAVDCTVGRAGHARLIAERLGAEGRLIALDVDPANVAAARAVLEPLPARCDVVHANFAQLPAVLADLNVDRCDLLLADLGFASSQMHDPRRGLSFSEDGPLDMRLDPMGGTTAAELVNTLGERQLADLIYQLGEEPLSRRIAQKIVEIRARSPIETTRQLADAVRGAYGRRAHRSRMHPATRTFMALRIAVNAELEALEALLDSLPGVLAVEARAALISFHSLEDRRVKQAFAALRGAGAAEVLTRKPVMADDAERRDNPRSRSARLRALRWLGTAAQSTSDVTDAAG